jgi:prepilin peptidase CpaA
MSPPSIVALACAIAISFGAALTDVRAGIIPNSLTLPPILLAPTAYAAFGGIRSFGLSLLAACVCGFVPYILFRVRAMGGGDVKLFAALGALHGQDLAAGLRIQLLAFAAAMLGALWLHLRHRRLRATLRRVALITRHALARRQPLPTLEEDGVGALRLGGFVLVATLLQSALLFTGRSVQ